MVSALVLSACGRAGPSETTPQDPFGSIGAGELPVAALAGAPVLLLPVGGILFGDSLAELRLQRADLLDQATGLVDSVLAREVREVEWHGPEAIRRTLRRAPAVAADPTRLPTGFLLARRVEVIPDPLWSSLRALAGLTGARMALVPVAVRLEGSPGAVRSDLVLALLDVRMGRLAWRGRASGGASATPAGALTAAVLAAVPSGIR